MAETDTVEEAPDTDTTKQTTPQKGQKGRQGGQKAQATGNGGTRKGRPKGEILAQDVEFMPDGRLKVTTNAGEKYIKLARPSLVIDLAEQARGAARSHVNSIGL